MTDALADTPARRGSYLTPVIFTATIFLSASLLFFVQPLFAKIVLPVIGGAPDMGQSFRRDIKQHVFEDTVTAMLSLFPSFKKLKLMRQWGGHLDIAHDASPIMSKTDVDGLFITAGWWGGYKAIPAGGLTLAHLVAKGQPHPLMADFTLDRFKHLDFVMESGTTTAR